MDTDFKDLKLTFCHDLSVKIVVEQDECGFHKFRRDMASSKDQEVEVLDNWEDIDDSDVLERQFSNMKIHNAIKGNQVNPSFSIVLSGDDALRSQYVPPEPTFKILKRPNKLKNGPNGNQITQPKKTLKQREQEYAEARLRILGEASSPEKSEEGKLACIQNKTSRQNDCRTPRGIDGPKGFTKR